MKQTLLSIGLLFFFSNLNAADNFTEVYQLLQTKCQSCHSGDAPAGNLDLSGTESEVYQALMTAEIDNQAAKDAGYSMVKPGGVR